MRSEADEIQSQALRAMSVEQRLRLVDSLRAFAWELKQSTIRRQHPELSESEVLRRVRAAFGHDRV